MRATIALLLLFSGAGAAEPSAIAVTLERNEGDTVTRVLLLGREVGTGEDAFTRLDECVRKAHEDRPDLPGAITASAAVPHREVVRAIDSFRKAGINDITFTGIPPPGQPENAGRGSGALPPRSALARPLSGGPAHLVIEIPRTGETSCDGAAVTFEEMRQAFLARARKLRDESGPGDPEVLTVAIAAAQDVRWREIQWVMRAAADLPVRVVKYAWFVRKADGTGDGFLEVFEPTGPGIDSAPEGLSVRMARGRDGRETRIGLGTETLGSGGAALASLRRRLDGLSPGYRGSSLLLDAGPFVPFGEVVGAVDAALAAGITSLDFNGAPPPGPDCPPVVIRGGLAVEAATPDDPFRRDPGPLPLASEATRDRSGELGIEVRVTASGGIACLCRDVGHDGIRELLAGRADPAAAPLVVAARADLPWREAERALRAIEDPAAAKRRVFWLVRTAEGGLGLLPAARPGEEAGTAAPAVALELRPEKGGPRTRVRLAGIGTDGGETDLDGLEESLRREAPREVAAAARLAVSPAVSFGAVVRAVDLLRAAGIREVRFTASPPSDR